MIKLFNEQTIGDFFRINDNLVNAQLDRYTDIETADPDRLSESISDMFKIKVPFLVTEDIKAIPTLEGRPGNSFSPATFALPNKIYEVAVVTYLIPFIGDPRLFSLQPSRFSSRSFPISIDNDGIHFKIYTEYANLNLSDEVKATVLSQAQSIIDFINNNLHQLVIDCDEYNANLKTRIKQAIEEKQASINQLKKLSNDLNPLR